MNSRLSSWCALTFVLGLAATANAQQAGGSYSTNTGYAGYAPPRHDVDNIGEDGQFVFGIERITGVYLDQHKYSYENEDGSFEHTYKTTNISLLGVDASSPSQLPRFALDYVIASGFTLGASVMYVHRSLSLDDGGGEAPYASPAARPEGNTFLVGGRVGYAYPFDDTFGIWPRAGISWSQVSTSYDATDPTSGDATTLDLRTRYTDIDLELLAIISPIEHIAILIGPYLDLGIGGSYKAELSGAAADERSAKLTSFGLLVSGLGYY